MIRTNYGTILKDFEVNLSCPKVVDNKYVETTITILSKYVRAKFLERFNFPSSLSYSSIKLVYNWSKDLWGITAIETSGDTYHSDDIIDVMGEFHYAMNRSVELETSFLTAEEFLVASRSKSEISYQEFKNLVYEANEVFYEPNGKFYNIDASLVTCPDISTFLGIFKDSSEYTYFSNKMNPFNSSKPYYVNLSYDTRSGFMRILFGRVGSNNECCYNIFDDETKNYFISLLAKTITKNSGEQIADKVLCKDRDYINDLKNKLKKAETDMKFIKDTLASLGEFID